MKEMCRNFICGNKQCQQASTTMPAAEISVVLPDTSMGDCNSCIMEQIGLAQAYIPVQPYEATKNQEQSLVCGTVFSELSMPYCSGWNLYRFQKEA